MNIKNAKEDFIETFFRDLERKLGLRNDARSVERNDDALTLFQNLLLERVIILSNLMQTTKDLQWISQELFKTGKELGLGFEPDFARPDIDDMLKTFISILEGWCHECKDLAKAV